MPLAVRDYRQGDEAFILRLNAACVPHVSEMDASAFASIAGWAHRILVAEEDGAPAGFVILIRPGSAYPSDNYAWFEDRFDTHLYVDRIAIDESARGKGAGRALYHATVAIARETGDPRVTAEVNEDPPNPASLAFHERLGFRPLESRRSRSGKIVVMLERAVEPS